MRSLCNLITIFLLTHFLKSSPFFNVNVEVEARKLQKKCEVKKAVVLNSLQACLGKVNIQKVINDGIESEIYLEGHKKCIRKYINRLNRINRQFSNCFQESPASNETTSTKTYFNLTHSDTINEQVSNILMDFYSLYTMSGIQATTTPVSKNHRVFIYPVKHTANLPPSKNGIPSKYDVAIKNAEALLLQLPPSSTKYPLNLINPFNAQSGGIKITDGFIFEMTTVPDMVNLLNAVNAVYPTMKLYLSYTGSSCQNGQTILFGQIYTATSLSPAAKAMIGADVYVDDELSQCSPQDSQTILSGLLGRKAIFVIGHNLHSGSYNSEWTMNNIGALMLYLGSPFGSGYPENLAHNAATYFTGTWATNSKSRIIYGTGGNSLSVKNPGPVDDIYVGSQMDYVNVCSGTSLKPRVTAGPETGHNVNRCLNVPTDPSRNNLLKSLQNMDNVDWYIGY